MDTQRLFELKRHYEFTAYFILALFLIIISFYVYTRDGRGLAAATVSFVALIWIFLGILQYASERVERAANQ